MEQYNWRKRGEDESMLILVRSEKRIKWGLTV